jgi:hypothetical protein
MSSVERGGREQAGDELADAAGAGDEVHRTDVLAASVALACLDPAIETGWQ